MYVLKGATQEHRDLAGSALSHRCELKSPELNALRGDTPPPDEDASADWAPECQLPTSRNGLIYLDPGPSPGTASDVGCRDRLGGFRCLSSCPIRSRSWHARRQRPDPGSDHQCRPRAHVVGRHRAPDVTCPRTAPKSRSPCCLTTRSPKTFRRRSSSGCTATSRRASRRGSRSRQCTWSVPAVPSRRRRPVLAGRAPRRIRRARPDRTASPVVRGRSWTACAAAWRTS